MNRLLLCSAWLGAWCLTGCATLSPNPDALINFQPETFSSKDTHSRRFNQTPGVICEAARRALLSQGYIISEAKADHVRARKLFQPGVDRHVELEFRVVCAGEGVDKRVTVAFANGVQDQYGMRKVKSSASLGVGGVGSLSLPVQGDNDTMVKIASETVTDHQMYQRLFDLMQRHLDPFASLSEVDAASVEDKKTTERPDAIASKPVPAAAPARPVTLPPAPPAPAPVAVPADGAATSAIAPPSAVSASDAAASTAVSDAPPASASSPAP